MDIAIKETEYYLLLQKKRAHTIIVTHKPPTIDEVVTLKVLETGKHFKTMVTDVQPLPPRNLYKSTFIISLKL